MIDYYINIRSASESKASFNLWPYQLKFELMRPTLIYRSRISSDNSITTELFPTQPGQPSPLSQLTSFARSRNLTKEKILSFASRLGIPPTDILDLSRVRLLAAIDVFRASGTVTNNAVCDALAKALYAEGVRGATVPQKLRHVLEWLD